MRTYLKKVWFAGACVGLLFSFILPASAAEECIITTVAGNGAAGFSGDGDQAIKATLSYPSRIAFDAEGNLFIMDLTTTNPRIRKVDPIGIITTVASSKFQGINYLGDGGSATEAYFDAKGIATDAVGNLYIADAANNRIRKVEQTTGIINTVVGEGDLLEYYPDDYVTFSGDKGLATQANLNYPHGVAFDGAGNLFIADSSSHRIRQVDADGIITTVAGSEKACDTSAWNSWSKDWPAMSVSLCEPNDIAVDKTGNLFFGYSSHLIFKLDSNGLINHVAGHSWASFSGDGGPATKASLAFPEGLAVDAEGNLFIADRGNNRIRKVSKTTGIITTVAGNGTAEFSGDGGPATEAGLSGPSGVAVDAAGTLFIADANNNRIRKVTCATNTWSLMTSAYKKKTIGIKRAVNPAASPVVNTCGYELADLKYKVCELANANLYHVCQLQCYLKYGTTPSNEEDEILRAFCLHQCAVDASKGWEECDSTFNQEDDLPAAQDDWADGIR